MRRWSWIVLTAALLLGLLVPASVGNVQAAPAQQAHVATVSHQSAHFFDKTRFLLHMGLAYYAFHHWVIDPLKKGTFKSGAKGRVAAIAKGAIATLFAVHEVKVSYDIAKGSHSATLHALIAPLNALMSAANKAYKGLKSGTITTATLTSLEKIVSSAGSTASKAGYGIKDIPYKIPGL